MNASEIKYMITTDGLSLATYLSSRSYNDAMTSNGSCTNT